MSLTLIYAGITIVAIIHILYVKFMMSIKGLEYIFLKIRSETVFQNITTNNKSQYYNMLIIVSASSLVVIFSVYRLLYLSGLLGWDTAAILLFVSIFYLIERINFGMAKFCVLRTGDFFAKKKSNQ